MLASEFISKLDSRFKKLKVDIENGAITRPMTLTEAFNRASRYKVTSGSSEHGYNQMTSFLASSFPFRGRGGRSARGRGRGEEREISVGKQKSDAITVVASSTDSSDEQ